MIDTEKAEESTEEQVILHSPGAIPGIPGDHGPGTYIIDWAARTIRPLVAPDPEMPATASSAPELSPQEATPEPLPAPESAPVTLAEIATEVTHLEADLQHIEQPG